MYWYSDLFGSINLTLGGKAPNHKKLAQHKNWIEFQNSFARLVKKGLARYEFEGLPETVNERVLKQAFLYHGSACFFEKEGNVLALPAMPDSNLTLYGDFKSCFVYGRNGYNAKVPLIIPGGAESSLVDKGFRNGDTKPIGVWVRENEMVYPFLNYCITYAEKIADTMRTLDVTRKNMKRPFIVVVEEQQVNSAKRFFEDRDMNVEYVLSSGIYDPSKVNVVNFEKVVENVKTSTDLIEWYLNDFDNLCGKNSNSNPDKKERLLVDEVNSNNESRKSEFDSMLEYMNSQLDLVNKSFGTNIKVVKREEEDNNDDIRRVADNSDGADMGGAGRSDSSDAD